MRGGPNQKRTGAAVTALLTLFALCVHGYHPYAEDGGLYVAGVKRLLDPTLYGPHAEFVTAHLRFSSFAPLVAAIVHITHLPLEWVLLALYLGSVWATLLAAWMLAAQCKQTLRGRCGAVALLACWLTLPIAGTSLMLMDPYLTARSLTTPLVLAALAWTIDAMHGNLRALSFACIALMTAAAIHPLMAAYGLAAAIVIVTTTCARKRWLAAAILCALAALIAGGIQALAPAESAGYLRVVRTRYYWFLSEWQWYERIGLIAPLALLSWINHRAKSQLATAAFVLGLIATAVNLGFAHLGFATHLVARLQPLRCLQLVYVVMILLLGTWLGERALGHSIWRWTAMIILLSGIMFVVQGQTYPASAHIEWPYAQPKNLWQQAFLWVRENTPKDALFAMNPHYIQAPGEDAQGFRAIAERNALPDYSKDGGEASITPSLTAEWVQGQAAQAGLDDKSDDARMEALKPLGVGWVVLRTVSPTSWNCPYRNELAKVCRMP